MLHIAVRERIWTPQIKSSSDRIVHQQAPTSTHQHYLSGESAYHHHGYCKYASYSHNQLYTSMLAGSSKLPAAGHVVAGGRIFCHCFKTLGI